MSAPKLNEVVFAGRFRILRELGRGGMGSVDIAYQTDLERQVALKRILPNNLGLASAEAWFRREYRALAAIPGSGVPAVYECGKTPEGVSYFTMEIIEGSSLETLIKQRQIDAQRAITVAIDLGRILAAAHAVGVIHRDVKPTNIILEASGRVRLIDFGICTFLPRFRGRADLRSVGDQEYKTGPLEIAGSPGYTDPALFTGHPPSVQSDVFSVCVVLYELLAGRRLYDERAGSHRQIDTGEFEPELAAVVGEIRRGVQPLPKDRHGTMDDLVRSLEIARSALTRGRVSAQPRVHRPLLFGLTLTNIGALVALGLVWSSARHDPVTLDSGAGPTTTDAMDSTDTSAPPESGVLPAIVPVVTAPPPEASKPAAAKHPPHEGPRRSPRPGPETARRLSQESVMRATEPAKDAIRRCVNDSRDINLEIMVDSGQVRLTRVEWGAFRPGDPLHACLLRALRMKRIRFPSIGSPGPYNLQISK